MPVDPKTNPSVRTGEAHSNSHCEQHCNSATAKSELRHFARLGEGEGVAAQVLVDLGVDLDLLRQQVIQLLAVQSGERPPVEEQQTSSVPRPQFSGARLAACSFCGLAPPESGQLVAGNDAFICERCLRQWVGRVDQRRRSRTGLNVTRHQAVPPGPQREDPDGARSEIETAFAAGNTESGEGQSVPTVEKGENLGPTLVAARANHPEWSAREVAISVDEVVFIDTQHAAVWFSISIDGRRLLRNHRGDAVVVDGSWKMARSTFCQLMAMGGISCPPEAG